MRFCNDVEERGEGGKKKYVKMRGKRKRRGYEGKVSEGKQRGERNGMMVCNGVEERGKGERVYRRVNKGKEEGEYEMRGNDE